MGLLQTQSICLRQWISVGYSPLRTMELWQYKLFTLGSLDDKTHVHRLSVGIPAHVKIDCSRVVSFTRFENRIPCFIYHTIQIPINTVHIVQKMLNELFWFSVLFKKRNAWRTLQRYDGMVQNNDIIYSCQHRRDNMKWDFSKGDCYCDKPVDNFPYTVSTDNPFGVKLTIYDPSCGQPTLRANLWYNWLMWLRHSMKVL